jgi:RND family efflux transporter MFP subunit
MKKILLILVVLAFLGVLSWRILALVKTEERSDPPGRPPVAVEVDSVRYAPIQEVQELTGTVHPFYQYVVAPKVPGRVLEIRKRIGDRVSKGERVARIDDAEYQQAVLEAEAALKIAQASLTETTVDLELARQQADRVSALQEKGIASRSELDTSRARLNALESRLKLSQAQIEQREAALNTAKIKLGYTVLTAPTPGYVGERYVDEGSLLSQNSPILLVIGINPVIVRTTIIERIYGRIRTGQSTEIEVDAFPSERFSGRVARIAPKLQEASRVAEMEIEVRNDSHTLKPGMFARVRIVLSEKESAQVVPTEALVTRNGETGVFLVGNGRDSARYVPVEAGIVSPDRTEILSPELDGMVVTMGQHLLEDGSPVILADRSAAPGEPGPPAEGPQR